VHELTEDPGGSTETVICQASPCPAIVDAALELNGQMIIMGTHGRSGLAYLLLDSVVEYVVRQQQGACVHRSDASDIGLTRLLIGGRPLVNVYDWLPPEAVKIILVLFLSRVICVWMRASTSRRRTGAGSGYAVPNSEG
jgi:hypothetical protein